MNIVRSHRRTLALQVQSDGTIVVRAPMQCSNLQIESFIKSHQSWLDSHVSRAKARGLAHPEPDATAQQALIAKASTQLPPLVAQYSAKMGLIPTGITITGAKTRFGSCSGKNRICFSWRLMQYPQEAIEYVVVHELAHIAHKNHGPQFYACVADIFPDYQERRNLLRQ